VDCDTSLFQRHSKVPHGGQENRDASFVRPYVLRFAGHFSHPDSVFLFVEIVEGCGMGIELIAQDHDQLADF
jgi:hypothetical protein